MMNPKEQRDWHPQFTPIEIYRPGSWKNRYGIPPGPPTIDIHVNLSSPEGEKIQNLAVFTERIGIFERGMNSYLDYFIREKIIEAEERGEAFQLWENFVLEIITAQKESGIYWHDEYPNVTPDFIEHYISQTQETSKIDVREVIYKGPLTKYENVFRVKSYFYGNAEDILYYFAARGLSKLDFPDIKNFLIKFKLLNPKSLFKNQKLFSFLTQLLFIRAEPDQFRQYIEMFVDEVPYPLGYYLIKGDIDRIAADVYPDSQLIRLYFDTEAIKPDEKFNLFPLLQKEFRRKEMQEKERKLQRQYLKRDKIIPDSMRSKQVNDDYWQELFDQVGASDNLRRLIVKYPLLKNIIEAALLLKKLESGLDLVFADILGYSKEEALEIASLMQIFWAGIVSLDDIVDMSQERSEKLGINKGDSLQDTLQKAMHALLIDGIPNKILSNLVEGDIKSREISWNSKFSQIESAMGKISTIFSWFPKSAGAETRLILAGQQLAQFANNFGKLVLINNDFDDLDNHSHKPGKDIGHRINSFWWQFSRSKKIPQEAKDLVKSTYEKIAEKKRQMLQLDHDDEHLINEVLELGRKYKQEVAQDLKQYINRIYFQALRPLEDAFYCLPVSDERNSDNLRILFQALNGIKSKLDGYTI